MQKNVLVLGCGVIGLTTAIRLLEEFGDAINVEIWTDKLPIDTVSHIAGAIWGPYHIEPQNVADNWALNSLKVFNRLAKEVGFKECGVYNVTGVTFETSDGVPSWLTRNEQLFHYRKFGHQMFTCKDLVSEYHIERYSNIYQVTLPMIDSSIYLDYLEKRFYLLGGKRILVKRLDSIDEVSHFEQKYRVSFDLVVNCTGFGSRKLFHDTEMVADVGQLVHIQLPSSSGAFGDDLLQGKFYDAAPLRQDGADITYILPRANNIYVLGGSSKLLTVEEMDGSPLLSAEISSRILKCCDALAPHGRILAESRIVAHKVAWRPFRKSGFRLEVSEEGVCRRRKIIHCYGAGGAGVTISYGVADEVVQMAQKYLHFLSSRL